MHDIPQYESLHEQAKDGAHARGAGSQDPASPTERQRRSGNDGTASGSDASGSIADADDPQNRIAHEQPATPGTGRP